MHRQDIKCEAHKCGVVVGVKVRELVRKGLLFCGNKSLYQIEGTEAKLFTLITWKSLA